MAISEKLCEVWVHLRTSGSDLVVKGQTFAEIDIDTDVRTLILRDFISYPDSRAYKLTFRYEESITEIWYSATIFLQPSKAYNFSYWAAKDDIIMIEEYASFVENRSYRENNVLITSENSMPFYFPVETSYRVGGNIKDLSLMVEQITDSQTGQYPLVILTDRGVFALQQGEGKVLYSNLIPISNDICSPGAVQTPRGVAYIANRCVNILAGREGINISSVLEGYLTEGLRENASFLLATQSEDLYDISESLSQIDFRDYLSGSKLFFDTVQNELIVSNTNYKYSYVFNFLSKSWHKITAVFAAGKGRLALQVNGTKVNLVDITDEYAYIPPDPEELPVMQTVHFHTKPLKFGTDGFKSIYRAIVRGEIHPLEPFGAYIFGSNDLNAWNMISAVQTESPVSNLRLFRAKYSYRYFIIMAGGLIQSNSNIAYIDLEIDDKYQNKAR